MDDFHLQQEALTAYSSLDPNSHQQHHFAQLPPNATWPLPLPHDHHDMSHNGNVGSVGTSPTARRANTSSGLPTRPATSAPPLQTSGLEYAQNVHQSALLPTAWHYQMANPQAYMGDATIDTSQYATGNFGGALQASPIDFATSSVHTAMNTTLPMDQTAFIAYSSGSNMGSLGSVSAMGNFQMSDFANELVSYGVNDGSSYQNADQVPSVANSSPAETWLEVRSNSSKSDNGWNFIDTDPTRNSFDAAYNSDFSSNGAINPQQTLHVRTDSNGSYQSEVPLSAHSFSSWEDVGNFPLYSPEPEVAEPSQAQSHQLHGMPMYSNECDHQHYHAHVSPPLQTATMADPVAQPASSSTSSPSSGASSPTNRRRTSPVRKSPVGITPKTIIKKKAPTSPIKKEVANEKRVGRRKGPLRPDQRQQAHEIRKMRACLRCKFLKKTCDKGDPCGGCQPSHARLWQVPCTRIDIKEVDYFMKDWKADYERHVSLGFSVGNIKGFSTMERPVYITHGYGYHLPITAREVYVRDDKCFEVDWTETISLKAFEVNTAKLSAGMEGVPHSILSEYLDRHIDGGFERFVDEYFEGTYFLTELLKTAYRYYLRSKLPVIRKALKLVIAYNLTMHVTMVEGLSEDELQIGKIDDPDSRWYGKTCAPVMINFQVKCSMADLWRELMKDILEELSALYSSVYSGEKLKNWPTIFMLAAILLAIWEEMQFDCHYRVPDQAAVKKFCGDMEATPVGVIVGLFSAISQKLPSFTEWDTRKHHHLLNSNPAVCEAMTEVREHVTKYESYLKSRADCKFDRQDFDSLSNKFLSKLVIRAN